MPNGYGTFFPLHTGSLVLCRCQKRKTFKFCCVLRWGPHTSIVLLMCPLIKTRIGSNILLLRNSFWSKVKLIKRRRENYCLDKENWLVYWCQKKARHRQIVKGRWKEKVSQCWSAAESVLRCTLKTRGWNILRAVRKLADQCYLDTKWTLENPCSMNFLIIPT